MTFAEITLSDAIEHEGVFGGAITLAIFVALRWLRFVISVRELPKRNRILFDACSIAAVAIPALVVVLAVMFRHGHASPQVADLLCSSIEAAMYTQLGVAVGLVIAARGHRILTSFLGLGLLVGIFFVAFGATVVVTGDGP